MFKCKKIKSYIINYVMCGITAILYNIINNGLEIYESLLSIQHRGQDGAGISNIIKNGVDTIKNKGLISDLCSYEELLSMKSNIYLAHTRYKTNNVVNCFQPFHLQSNNLNMTFCHNGNIINTTDIIHILNNKYNLHNFESESDSFLLFQLIFCYLDNIENNIITTNIVIELSNFLHETLEGSYSVILGIENYGIIVMKDKYGIRPLIYGRNTDNDIIISSESCSVNNLVNYKVINDVMPGETIVFLQNNDMMSYKYKHSLFRPCLFEYIYFSRLDSIFNQISVYRFRYLLGELLGKILMKEKENLNIDFIIPTPETSRVYAYGMSKIMNIPIQECIIKNRYINRTFIIENKDKIDQNIKRKFAVIGEVVKDKTAILIDDSIVRGNTSKNIIKLLKNSGIKKLIFCSASPKIYNVNKYGIYIEQKNELITYKNKTNEDIAHAIGADKVYYNSLEDVHQIINYLNPKIYHTEISMFIDN